MWKGLDFSSLKTFSLFAFTKSMRNGSFQKSVGVCGVCERPGCPGAPLAHREVLICVAAAASGCRGRAKILVEAPPPGESLLYRDPPRHSPPAAGRKVSSSFSYSWRWGLSKVGVGCANSPGDSRQSGPRCVSVCSCVPTGRNIWAASLGIAASPSPLLKQWTPLAGSRAWDRESDRGEGAGILDSDEIGEDVISDYIALLDPERNHTSPSLHVLCLPCLLAPRDAQT